MIKFAKKHMSPFTITVLIILTVFSISLFMPLLWGVITSFKSRGDFISNVFGLPKQFMFSNYMDALSQFKVGIEVEGGVRQVPLWEMLINSILFSLGSAFFATLSPCIMAYVSAKYPYKFSRVIVNLVVISLIVPTVGGLPATLQITRGLNIYNTLGGMFILKAGFTGMYFLVFFSAFKNLSWEYAEAAFVDGASHARIMFRIMLPLVYPIIFAVFLIFFINFWNDYQTPMVFLPSMPTAALGMFLYSQSSRISSVPQQITGCMILIIPIIIIFLIFKNKLMGNVTMGGIKG